MNLSIVSVFSNSVPYLDSYFEQMADLQQRLLARGIGLHLVLGYGDSTDGTGEALFEGCANRFSATLYDVSHGKTVYGSVATKRRFRQLSVIGNTLWSLIPKGTDYAGLVESDLIWKGETLEMLLVRLMEFQSISSRRPSQFMVAPMVLKLSDASFYDTYAYRKDGFNFEAQPPFHPALVRMDGDYLEMDSVGSCFITDIRTARLVTWPEKDVVVGLCDLAREVGTRIFLIRSLEVYHP